MRFWETGEDLRALLLADPAVAGRIPTKELDKAFDPSRHFRDVNRTFRPLGLG